MMMKIRMLRGHGLGCSDLMIDDLDRIYIMLLLPIRCHKT